jgi:hypothetical protein
MVDRYLAAAQTLWLSLTILCQLPGQLPQALRALDLLSLIPAGIYSRLIRSVTTTFSSTGWVVPLTS